MRSLRLGLPSSSLSPVSFSSFSFRPIIASLFFCRRLTSLFVMRPFRLGLSSFSPGPSFVVLPSSELSSLSDSLGQLSFCSGVLDR